MLLDSSMSCNFSRLLRLSIGQSNGAKTAVGTYSRAKARCKHTLLIVWSSRAHVLCANKVFLHILPSCNLDLWVIEKMSMHVIRTPHLVLHIHWFSFFKLLYERRSGSLIWMLYVYAATIIHLYLVSLEYLGRNSRNTSVAYFFFKLTPLKQAVVKRIYLGVAVHFSWTLMPLRS